MPEEDGDLFITVVLERLLVDVPPYLGMYCKPADDRPTSRDLRYWAGLAEMGA
jgi:hypothetical protein